MSHIISAYRSISNNTEQSLLTLAPISLFPILPFPPLTAHPLSTHYELISIIAGHLMKDEDYISVVMMARVNKRWRGELKSKVKSIKEEYGVVRGHEMRPEQFGCVSEGRKRIIQYNDFKRYHPRFLAATRYVDLHKYTNLQHINIDSPVKYRYEAYTSNSGGWYLGALPRHVDKPLDFPHPPIFPFSPLTVFQIKGCIRQPNLFDVPWTTVPAIVHTGMQTNPVFGFYSGASQLQHKGIHPHRPNLRIFNTPARIDEEGYHTGNGRQFKIKVKAKGLWRTTWSGRRDEPNEKEMEIELEETVWYDETTQQGWGQLKSEENSKLAILNRAIHLITTTIDVQYLEINLTARCQSDKKHPISLQLGTYIPDHSQLLRWVNILLARNVPSGGTSFPTEYASLRRFLWTVMIEGCSKSDEDDKGFLLDRLELKHNFSAGILYMVDAFRKSDFELHAFDEPCQKSLPGRDLTDGSEDGEIDGLEEGETDLRDIEQAKKFIIWEYNEDVLGGEANVWEDEEELDEGVESLEAEMIGLEEEAAWAADGTPGLVGNSWDV